ncbi:MAG: hypothetical protein R6V47_00600, partial [Candidatus Delongbacteria bacterium]
GKTAANMKEGEVSELIIQDKAISVIKVYEVQKPMLYKFEYVEDTIKRRLIDINREMFLDNYRQELFEKYNVAFIDNAERGQSGTD